jgi:AcrB/AcrD/AcrF family/Barrel-sandwich domain of CusB or HlyD membrane-fusion
VKPRLAALVPFALALAIGASAEQPQQGKILYYRDPMDRPYYSAEPKKDEMGMDYIPVYEGEEDSGQAPPPPAAPAAAAKGKVLYYRNPMGLPDTSPVPKKDWMGMDYIPVYESEAADDTGTVKIGLAKVQKLGVQSAPVERRTLSRAIRAVGTVQADERRLYIVNTKFEGWIDKLYVNATGETVQRGQPLMEIYAPELVVAEREYLLAWRSLQDLAGASPEIRKSASQLADAALQRLSNWDISADQVKRLQRAGSVTRTLTLRAPADGTVMEKIAVEGMHFTAGDPLYRIADLSSVWLTAEVFEQDIGTLRRGQDATIAVNAKALDFPGVSNAWTMPIKARIDMLSTGIRTPVGVKVYGTDLAEIDRLAKEIEAVVRTVPGTASAFAERVLGGYYLNIEPDRAALDRYGLSINDVQEVVQTALGGETVTSTVEGRERFTVNVRYPRGLRDDPQAIASQVLVNGSDGTAIPLGQVASIKVTQGAPSIRTENAQLVDYIYVDLQGRDLGSYVADAQRAVREQVKFPPGYHVEWSGQFEYLERAKARLQTVVPLTLYIIFLLLYLNFRRLTETLIVMLSVPFALTGGLWLMYLMGFNISVAVAVGFIALAGVAAETGVVMLIYLDHAFTAAVHRRRDQRHPLTAQDLHAAIIEGAVERVRPKMMTVSAIMAGLLPILWSTGTGSEVMRRIAVPMVGGMVSSTVLTLLVIPAIYAIVKGWQLSRSTAMARPVEKHPLPTPAE